MAGQTKVVLVLLLTVAATAFGNHGCLRCPAGWSLFKGRCFQYFGFRTDWASAEKHCLTQGAHLISIHNEEDYQHAKSIIRAQDPGENPTWIGLSRCKNGLNWSWSDGTQVTFTKWNPGEPNTLPNEFCVHMNWFHSFTSHGIFFGSGIKNWNNIPCNNVYPFVCVKRSQ
ncbi:lactose-binding lectin l-2-like [Clarias gariepinus]|uniref:lactose-binding lectin l-2-like n=1 Tax=Clarias gariepinus TaxID=13013 RepID=UPI00234CC78C|nr:lactose-binding lectin l-2-like [Clarias gariepinus]